MVDRYPRVFPVFVVFDVQEFLSLQRANLRNIDDETA